MVRIPEIDGDDLGGSYLPAAACLLQRFAQKIPVLILGTYEALALAV